MSDPSKTEKATPKRLKKTRKEGNVAKSQELSKLITTAVGVFGLSMYFDVFLTQLQDIFRYIFTEAVHFEVNSDNVYSLMLYVAGKLAIILLPIILFIGFAAFAVLRWQVGALWAPKVFEFKWSRFNIFNGLKGMFGSTQTLVRLVKSIGQSVVIGAVPYWYIRGEIDNFLPLYYGNAATIGAYMLDTGFSIVLYTMIPMAIIAAIDYFYTNYTYDENIKMSKQEVKDEHRQQEGDPLMKQRQRQKMMETMSRRMLQDVPKADVVITNPTHIAVALRYDTKEAPAPMVVAIGVNHLAEKIKEIARENNVPIRENVPLARALYKAVDVGDLIPDELFKAVASVLASVWRTKGKPKR